MFCGLGDDLTSFASLTPGQRERCRYYAEAPKQRTSINIVSSAT